MAWQNSAAMGNGGGPGGGAEGGNNGGQSLGTEYTLQGTTIMSPSIIYAATSSDSEPGVSCNANLKRVSQESCGFFRQSGIGMNEIAMLGR